MDGDIRTNKYDDGSTDFETGEQKIRNFNINFGPQHPAATRISACCTVALKS
jgi:NADH-quinone oxidoreductase subunit D